MTSIRRSLLIVSLLLAVLVLAGCGDQPTEITTPDTSFLLSLARVVIDIDSNGVPSVAGFNTARLNDLTFGMLDLRWMRMDPAYVRWFTDADVQHVEFVHKDDGLYLFVNGEAMPHVTWTDDSLTAVRDVVNDSGVFTAEMSELVDMLIPFIQRVALDVVVRFPVAAGQESLPLRAPGEGFEAPNAQDEPALSVNLVLPYDEQGELVLAPGTERVLQGLGVDVDQVRLAKSTVNGLVAADVQHITMRKQGNGLLLYVNGKALPHLAWTENGLENSADLFGQLFYTPEYELTRQTVQTLLPLLAEIGGSVTVRLPVSSGADPIPLPE